MVTHKVVKWSIREGFLLRAVPFGHERRPVLRSGVRVNAIASTWLCASYDDAQTVAAAVCGTIVELDPETGLPV